MNLNTSKLYGLVLAGGKSTRMQEDKSQLNYHGMPQIDYCINLLNSFCAKTFVSCQPNQLNIHNQMHDNNQYQNIGPLGGILSSMEQYPNVSWIVLACDLPFVSKGVISQLIKNRTSKAQATAFLSNHYKGCPEPLCAIYENRIFKHLKSSFEKGIKCPRKILMNADTHLIEPLDWHALDNVNNLDEFEQAKNRIKDGLVF